ncbi:MAG: hypothetical protein HDS11_01865 [Bacteroides sp.]|nr:hypothetical protein [Bacteroides sp.]
MKPLHILTLMTALGAMSAAAQDLSREITVDREIIPVEQDARRLPLIPQVSLPPVKAVTLEPTQRAVSLPVSATVRLLDPVERIDPQAPPHTRGYLTLGLGAPLFVSDLSAGYRIIDRDDRALRAWLQWNSTDYKQSSEYWRDRQGTLGIDGARRFASGALLEGGVAASFGRFNQPLADYWQTTARVDADLAWHARTGGLTYNVGARYGWFGYMHSPVTPFDGAKQNRVSVSGDGMFAIADASDLGLSAALDLLTSNAAAMGDTDTRGTVTLTPMWRLRAGALSMTLGPRIDMTFGGGKFFHIAPDVKMAWVPSSMFGIDVELGGGEHVNALADLALLARRQSPYLCYGMSHVPLTVNAGITVGPFRGAWARIYGGWAKANNWLMPTLWSEGGMAWTDCNVSGARAGLELGARIGSLAEVTAAYTIAQSGKSKAWIDNRDRAGHVVDARLRVTPLAGLDLTATYQLRAHRLVAVGSEMHNLGNLSLLGVRAAYALNQSVSVFVSGDNLLNRSTRMLDLAPSQGINAMIGGALKF